MPSTRRRELGRRPGGSSPRSRRRGSRSTLRPWRCSLAPPSWPGFRSRRPRRRRRRPRCRSCPAAATARRRWSVAAASAGGGCGRPATAGRASERRGGGRGMRGRSWPHGPTVETLATSSGGRPARTRSRRRARSRGGRGGEVGRVVGVEDEVVDHEVAGGGDEVAAARAPFLAGADDLGRAHVEAEGEAGDGAVVGDGDLAAERLEGAVRRRGR